MKVNKYSTVLVRDRAISYKAEIADRPEVIKGVLSKLFHADRLPTERFWQLCVNCKMNVIGAFETATGNSIACVADTASIARNALLTGAVGVILAHNHPSGDSKPSVDDIRITEQTKAALRLFNIDLLDHIIITQHDYYSFKENGLL